LGFNRLPRGAVTLIGSLNPSLNGMSGLVSADLIADSAADTVEANGQFRLRRTCAHVPAKSTEMVSPDLVTAALTTNGVSERPSSSTASSP